VIDRRFRPSWDGDSADPLSFADEIGDQPAPVALLNVFDAERNELFPPQSGAEEQAQQRAIALRFQTCITGIT
jgi:hypothetical protein